MGTKLGRLNPYFAMIGLEVGYLPEPEGSSNA